MPHDPTETAARPSAFAAPTRRQLLGTTALLALTAGLLTTPFARYAVAADAFSAEQKLLLLKIARDIYPHDTLLDNAPYQAVIDNVLKEAEKDEKVAKLVTDGLADVNKRANATFKSNFVDIKSPASREAVLRQVELTDFFQKIRSGLMFGLYANKDVYTKMGYDGPSYQNGGFIKHPSFGKVDWIEGL
jgi:Gluconate 2-dehydrogenase subunit 3